MLILLVFRISEVKGFLTDRKIITKKYRENHREQILQYQHENKELYAKHGKNWRLQNTIRKAEMDKKWREENPEKMKEYKIKHYLKISNGLGVTLGNIKRLLQEWTLAVRQRDKICQVCGDKAELSHHIFYRIFYPELALLLNNGIALCKDCHHEVHYGVKVKNK